MLFPLEPRPSAHFEKLLLSSVPIKTLQIFFAVYSEPVFYTYHANRMLSSYAGTLSHTKEVRNSEVQRLDFDDRRKSPSDNEVGGIAHNIRSLQNRRLQLELLIAETNSQSADQSAHFRDSKFYCAIRKCILFERAIQSRLQAKSTNTPDQPKPFLQERADSCDDPSPTRTLQGLQASILEIVKDFLVSTSEELPIAEQDMRASLNHLRTRFAKADQRLLLHPHHKEADIGHRNEEAR